MGYVGRKPADAALTSADIAPGSVDTAQLAADAVTTAKIAPATVASSDIAPATIAASNIAPGTVTTTQIAPGTIAASNIAPGTITTTQIAPATVAASNIAPGTITTTQISPAVPLGVPAVSSDPPSPNEGDMWLRKDLTSNQLKAYLTAATSFSSAPNYPITAYALVGAGTGTDTTFVGGFQMPGSSSTNTSNEYDGTSFSGAPNYPLSVYGHAMAVNSPGSSQRIAAGRTYPGSANNTVNTYDGTSFSSGPSLSVARYLHLGGGPSSAMKVVGGDPAPGSNTAEDWNGSSWASGTMIPSGRHAENGMNMVGPSSDMCVAGGRDAPSSPYPGVAYKWDGSAWSTLAPRPPMLPSSHTGNNLCFGSGSSDLYTVGGEDGSPVANGCQKYNGTTWVSQANYPLSKAWIGGGSAGNASTSGNGILAGGSPPTNNCNEYTYGLAVTDLN
tara:strand:- start:730 stop:2064 length:1335 start_codon:yes stop_codon:yes gene_type:complete